MGIDRAQRPQEFRPPQCKYYGSVKENDTVTLRALISEIIPNFLLNVS